MKGSRQGSFRLLYVVILGQFVIIAVLLGALSNEYLWNDYYRGWIGSNYPWLGFLLQGQLDALLIGIALGATALLVMTIRDDRQVEPKVESQSKTTVATSRPEWRASPYETDDRISDRSTHDVREDVMIELEREDA
jgi:hypothetical protein